MRPISTFIDGFGPHRGTEIIWEAAGDVVTLVAPNGAGKTSLLEADFFAMYGEWPSRPGPIDEFMAHGATQAEVRSVFESKGETFSITRIITRTESGNTSHKARLRDAFDQIIAGPKLGDFAREVWARFGSKATALATWFSSQACRGDLTTGTAGERRAVLGEIMEFGRLDRYAERCKMKAIAAEHLADTLEKQLLGTPPVDDLIVERNGDKYRLEAEIEKARKDRNACEQMLESTRTDLATLKASRTHPELAIKAHEDATRRVDEINAAIEELKKEIEALEKKANTAPFARADEVSLEREKKTRMELGLFLEQFKAHDRWARLRETMAFSVGFQQQRIDLLEKMPGFSAEDHDLAEQRAEFEKTYSTAFDWNDDLRKQQADRAKKVSGHEAHVKLAAKGIEDLEAKIAKKPETPAPDDVCEKCPLMKAWVIDLPTELEALIEDRKAHMGELRAIDADPFARLIELEPLLQRATDAKVAADAVAKAGRAVEDIKVARADYVDVAAELERHDLEKPRTAEDPSVEMLANQHRIDTLAGAPERLTAAVEAGETLGIRQVLLGKKMAEGLDDAERWIETKVPAQHARARLDDFEGEQRRLDEQEEARTTSLRMITTEIEDASGKLGGLVRDIEHLERMRDESAAKRLEKDEARASGARLRTLQECFGPTGVQAIMIDAVAPELEGICSGLLDTLTDGKMQMRIVTQTTNKGDGALRENLKILARDQNGERDVMMFSGGEQRLLRTVLRIGVAMWQTRLRGIKPESLRIDEGFDALDPDNAERMTALLVELSQKFGQIIVVTHDEGIANQLPDQIRLKKTFQGVEVQTNGI